MGFWAGIKYALNSTLGTKDFTPIDVQIAEMQTLYASDELYATIGDSITLSISKGQPTTITKKMPYKIKMYSTGNLRFSCDANFALSASSVTMGLKIYKNENIVYQTAFLGNVDLPNERTFLSDIISFNKNDIFSFEASFSNSSNRYDFYAKFSGIKILGTIKQNALKIMEA